MTKLNKSRKFIATSATAALVASAIVPVASAAQINDFNSISSYAQEAVQDLNDRGVIKGDQKGNFNPKNNVTRAEAATILTKALGLEGSGSTSFNDVNKSAWFYDAIDAAVSNGIFQGQGAGKFNPSGNLTRSEAAIILVDAFGLEGTADLSEFKDSASVKSWAQEALEIAVANGVMKGDAGSLKPNASISRQDFAVMYHRTEALEVTEEDVVSANVKAINNTTVEVTFEDAVADVKALDFAIEGLTVSNAVVKQTDSKTVVLTTSAQTADVSYTVTVDGEAVGTFKGVSAVIPTKVELVSSSVQGKLGQQVSVQAKVTVADGASKAGIPVTFSIPGNTNDAVYSTVVGEAVTNADGVATYTYTRYGAGNDTVTAYATGDRSKFAIGYVFWGVDTILAITEVTEGANINNGANKTYKITYKDPETGKPVANQKFNVGFLENMNVTSEKLANATVNGVEAKQLNNGSSEKAAQISTDSKGEATFTVSGVNTAVTPVVYALNDNKNNSESALRYKASALQASAAKVTFGAVQADYKIELKRDGGEVAATGYENGRKYNVVVKTKDGKAAANEIVNVAFNENLDRVISTNTTAEFIKLDDEDNKVGYDGKTITVKTNAKGEASFYIGSNKVDDYATPVAWIDINTSNAKEGNLDEGEPSTVAEISYFQTEYVDGASIRVADEDDNKKTAFDGEGPAVFSVHLANQSGEKYRPKANEGIETVSYTVFNEGDNEVRLYEGNKEVIISPNRSYTLTNHTGDLKVYSVDGKTTAVRVVATGVARYIDVDANNVAKKFNFSTKDAKATFTNEKSVPASYTGYAQEFNTLDTGKNSNSFWFHGKNPVKYAGVTGKTFKYYGANGNEVFGEKAWEDLLTFYATATIPKSVRISYNVDGDTISFKIISVEDAKLDVNGDPINAFGSYNAPSSKNVTATVRTASVQAKDATPATITSSVIADVNVPSFTFTLNATQNTVTRTATTTDTANINVSATDTAAQIVEKISAAFATKGLVTATVENGRVVIKGATGVDLVMSNANADVFSNGLTEYKAATPAQAAVIEYDFTATPAINLTDGDKLTVNGITYTAGTANVGYTFDASGTLADDLTALAVVITAQDVNVTAASLVNVLTLTERAGREGKASASEITFK